MSFEEKCALASDPATDVETLREFAGNPGLAPHVYANPSAPHGLKAELLKRHPEFEVDEVGAAFDALRARSAAKLASPTPASGRGGQDRILELYDANGNPVRLVGGAPERPTSGLAIASLVTSLLGLSLVGVILGHSAVSQMKRTGDRGEGLATAGLVIGYGGLALSALLLLVL